MSEAQDILNQINENNFILGGTLRVINSLEIEGLIGRYAIGGAAALMLYIEPIYTDDLDIFCHIPNQGVLSSLAPLYKYLEKLGYHPEGAHIIIENVPVQFLPPTSALVEEALNTAMEKEIEGIKTRVFGYEYLLAISAQTGRGRDRSKIVTALESAPPDEAKLQDILKRYDLTSKWKSMTYELE